MTAPTRASVVSLRAITAASVRAVCDLAVRPDQARFVATNVVSLAEANFHPHAWFRAIHADDVAIGFVMLDVAPGQPAFLWRFMIDARFQALGLGRRALDLVLDHVRGLGQPALETCVVTDPDGPQRFYQAAGFEPTGAYEDGQRVLRRVL